MTPEGKVKQKIKEWAEKNVPLRFRFAPRGGPFGQAGTADELDCWYGIFIAIEVKREGGDLSALQLRKLKEVKAACGIAAVIKGFDLPKLILIRKMAIERAYCFRHLLEADQQRIIESEYEKHVIHS